MFRRPDSIVKPSQALPLTECLAKSNILNDGSCVNGVDVATHCRIVGSVAKEIMARMPVWLKTGLFPDGSELIAAAHDIGVSLHGIILHFKEKYLPQEALLAILL
jgi:CRISPR-associated endonuclease/helicase Cas3